MNILYCGDKNILDGVLISVLSLMEHVHEPLHIHLLTAAIETQEKNFEPLPDTFVSFLNRLLKNHHEGSCAKLFDVTELFREDPPTANLLTRFTPCCMLRLYADRVRELPSRVLYLDTDVICCKDPSKFYHQDLYAWQLAGCLDYYGSLFFRKKLWKRDYLNSGVLLLNMDAIRITELFEKCRKLCKEKTMFMPDQSAINKLAHRKKICGRQYNEQRKLHKETVFQHFTTSFRFFPYFHAVSVKPWNIDGMHNILKLHEYDHILQQYTQEKTNYNEEIFV
ncbi:MAG: hypothetical protein J6J43_08865 [Oscillospiraceae bacterium]|nr:hypothetical protein [Oscillospiraceae bacterium]